MTAQLVFGGGDVQFVTNGPPTDPNATVYIIGTNCGGADLLCSCGHKFLSTGGEWGDLPEDRPEMRLHGLIKALIGHRCPAPADAAGNGVRVYEVADGFVVADDGGWLPGAFPTHEAAVEAGRRGETA